MANPISRFLAFVSDHAHQLNPFDHIGGEGPLPASIFFRSTYEEKMQQTFTVFSGSAQYDVPRKRMPVQFGIFDFCTAFIFQGLHYFYNALADRLLIYLYPDIDTDHKLKGPWHAVNRFFAIMALLLVDIVLGVPSLFFNEALRPFLSIVITLGLFAVVGAVHGVSVALNEIGKRIVGSIEVSVTSLATSSTDQTLLMDSTTKQLASYLSEDDYNSGNISIKSFKPNQAGQMELTLKKVATTNDMATTPTTFSTKISSADSFKLTWFAFLNPSFAKSLEAAEEKGLFQQEQEMTPVLLRQ